MGISVVWEIQSPPYTRWMTSTRPGVTGALDDGDKSRRGQKEGPVLPVTGVSGTWPQAPFINVSFKVLQYSTPLGARYPLT